MKFKFFTIVELLIVIAILAILVAVLMPALSKARSKAHQITCIGNCKSILLSLHSYSGDENEWIPPIITNSSDSSTYWIYKLERYGLKRKISRCPAQMNETYHFDYSANFLCGRSRCQRRGGVDASSSGLQISVHRYFCRGWTSGTNQYHQPFLLSSWRSRSRCPKPDVEK